MFKVSLSMIYNSQKKNMTRTIYLKSKDMELLKL